jgi:hypothetical protein
MTEHAECTPKADFVMERCADRWKLMGKVNVTGKKRARDRSAAIEVYEHDTTRQQHPFIQTT